MDSKSTTSSDDTVIDGEAITNMKDPSHLAILQSVGACLRDDPAQAVERLTRWFASEGYSPYWTPFALSIRGCAFEELDDVASARDDYHEALSLYRYMSEQLGDTILVRFRDNVRFIETRLKVLPPGEIRPQKDFVVIDDSL